MSMVKGEEMRLAHLECEDLEFLNTLECIDNVKRTVINIQRIRYGFLFLKVKYIVFLKYEQEVK